MFDSHGYYGQPGLTAQQFLPQGLFGAAPTAFAPYAAFGTLQGPWVQPTGPSIGGWPGQQLPLGALAPQGLFGALPGQHAHPFGTFGTAQGNPQFTGLGPEGPNHQQVLLTDPVTEVAEQVNAGPVGPVQIFEQHHHGCAGRQRAERVTHLAQHAFHGCANRFPVQLFERPA